MIGCSGTDTSFICWDRKMEYSHKWVPCFRAAPLYWRTMSHSTARSRREPQIANTGSKLKGKDPEIAIHGGIKIQKIVETALNGYLGQGDGGP